MRYKWIIFFIPILAVAIGGVYISWFYFVPVPTPEQIVWQINMQIKEEEEERLNREAEEDAKLLASDSLPNMTVSEIARNPNKYDKRLVRLRGCIFSGFETFVMRDCTPDFDCSNIIWLEPSINFVLFTEKVSGKKQHWRTLLPQSETQAAMLKLLFRNEYSVTPATVEGEFQSSDGHYGTPGDYKYRLILHRVIEVGSSEKVEQIRQ